MGFSAIFGLPPKVINAWRLIALPFTDMTLNRVIIEHGGGGGGGVTPIDSIVTTATAVGQWSMVKAVQKGAVNGQNAKKASHCFDPQSQL